MLVQGPHLGFLIRQVDHQWLAGWFAIDPSSKHSLGAVYVPRTAAASGDSWNMSGTALEGAAGGRQSVDHKQTQHVPGVKSAPK